MGVAQEASTGRGRPRDRALDDRILDQLLTLLGSHGYAGLTLDELAARSGVAKTTILRRWPSKAAVAAAANARAPPRKSAPVVRRRRLLTLAAVIAGASSHWGMEEQGGRSPARHRAVMSGPSRRPIHRERQIGCQFAHGWVSECPA